MKRIILDFEHCNGGCHFYGDYKCFHPKLPSIRELKINSDPFDSRILIPYFCLLEDTPEDVKKSITTVDDAFKADKKRQDLLKKEFV